jgi:simple sugar transport system permease protein
MKYTRFLIEEEILMLKEIRDIKRYILFARPLGIALVTIILIIVFNTVSPTRITPKLLQTILATEPEVGVIAIGQALLIIAGEFDLSVGSLLAFCSYIFVSVLNSLSNPLIAILITLGVGALAGMLNGFLVVYLKVPSLIATLGMMWFWRGIVYLVTGGFPIPYDFNKSPYLRDILTGIIHFSEEFGFPIAFLWFIIITFIAWVILEHTVYGNWIYATGGNVETARARGINVKFVKMTCFTILGFLTAFGALLQATRVGSAYPLAGSGYELYTIASAVIGGTSLRGGVGTIIGTFFGALLLEIIDAGLILLRAPTFWFQAFLGATVILACIINIYIDKAREKTWRRIL